MQKHKIIIIIPCLNEEKTIIKICNKAQKYGKVLVVDDNSIDNTRKILIKNKIKFLKNKKNIGYEASLIKGIKHTIKFYKNIKYLVTLDADEELPPESIPKLLYKLKKNNLDIIIGYRKKMNRYSEIVLNFLYKLRFNINDPVCGLKIYTIEVLKKTIGKISTNMFLVDILTLSNNYNYSLDNFKINVKKRIGSPRVGNFFRSNLKIIRIIIHTLFFKKL